MQLRTREKWQTEHQPIEVGKIVILRKKQLRSSQWSLGRVTKFLPDAKGNVQFVEILSEGRPPNVEISYLSFVYLEISRGEKFVV